MRNVGRNTVKTEGDNTSLNILLLEARMAERRARAEIISSRMINLANHIKKNQLDINEVIDLLFQESETYRHQAMENH